MGKLAWPVLKFVVKTVVVQVRTCSDKYFDEMKQECGVVDFTTPVVPTACLTVTLLNIILHVYLCLCTV